MNKEELARERRRQARLEKLGTNEPRCGTCGEDRWQCLERHHVAGQAYSEDIVLLCRNCHRVVSDVQGDQPTGGAVADPMLFAIGRFLLGLADMLRIIMERLIVFGRELTARAALPVVEDAR